MNGRTSERQKSGNSGWCCIETTRDNEGDAAKRRVVDGITRSCAKSASTGGRTAERYISGYRGWCYTATTGGDTDGAAKHRSVDKITSPHALVYPVFFLLVGSLVLDRETQTRDF